MKKGLHFTVLLAFLVGVMAPACGFAWGGKYSVIEICTAQGIESRVVSKDDLPDTPHLDEQCQFCFAQTHLIAYFPFSKALKENIATNERVQQGQYEEILLSRLSQDHAARAPPAFI